MKPFKLLALAVVLAAPAIGQAQNASGMTYEQFNHIDKDGSGTISEAEYRAFMEGAFKELDTDKNNSLSRAEAGKVLTPEQFSAVDVNKDGRLNRQEFMDHVMDDFHSVDHDNDGELHP